MRAFAASLVIFFGGVASAQSVPPGAIGAFHEGKKLLKERQPDGAIEKLAQAVKLAPAYVEAWTELGNAHLEKQDFENAIGAFESALKLKPDQTVARYNLAFSLRKLGRYRPAAEQYRLYLQAKPNDSDAFYGLAESLRAAGDTMSAADAYEAYARTEKNPAQEKWVKKARDTAAELRQEGLKKAPLNKPVASADPRPNARPNAPPNAAQTEAQGNLHLSFSEKAPAATETKQPKTNGSARAAVASRKRPESFRAGLADLKSGDFEAALPRLVTADREMPNDPLILAAIASAHLGLENGKEAETMYQQAISLASEDAMPGLYLGLGEARRLLGKNDLALDAYQRALSHERATRSIKRFSEERITALE